MQLALTMLTDDKLDVPDYRQSPSDLPATMTTLTADASDTPAMHSVICLQPEGMDDVAYRCAIT